MNLRGFSPILFSFTASLLLTAGVFLLLGFTSQAASAAPVDLFVTTAGVGTDCTQAAPCSLATAVGQALETDTIYVAQGTYTGTGGAVITVTVGIQLLGGWDGSPAGPLVRDPDAYPAVLDGEDVRRGVYISGFIAPTLDGFIITRGNASLIDSNTWFGGGIYSENANPIIANNVITDNVASSSTSGWAHGGGVFIQSSPGTTIIRNNTFANNTGGSQGRGKGGGFEAMSCSRVLILDNVFVDNVAGTAVNGMGGAISLQNSTATISGNRIQANQAIADGTGYGGGFYSQFNDITLDRNTILNNAAQYGAVTFEQNTNITLTNNIIAQNPTGGVFIRGNNTYPITGTLANNTIADNGGEGVYAGWDESGNATLALANNIIAGNAVGIYAYTDPYSNVVTATHTLFYGNDLDINGTIITSTNEITGSAPLFVDAVGMDYHIQLDSPAKNAGLTLPWLTVDIDGETRPWGDGGVMDIGADEVLYGPRIYLPLVTREGD